MYKIWGSYVNPEDIVKASVKPFWDPPNRYCAMLYLKASYHVSSEPFDSEEEADLALKRLLGALGISINDWSPE